MIEEPAPLVNPSPVSSPRLGGRHPALVRLLQVGVMALVAGFIALAVARDWAQFSTYSWQIAPGWLIAALLVLLARAPVQVGAWRGVLRLIGGRLGWRAAFRVYFQSGLAKYLPGSLWYAVGRVVLAEGAGVPRRLTTLSIVLEQVLNTLAALLVAGLALGALPNLALWPYLLVLAGLGAFVLWPRPAFALLNRGLRRLGRPALDVTLRGGDLLLALLPFVANWLWYGVASFCWTAAVYPTLSPGQLPVLIGLYTASWAIGFLTLVVPNGWGVREGVLIAGLTGVLGLPLPAAGAAAVLSRLGSIGAEVFWALVTQAQKEDG